MSEHHLEFFFQKVAADSALRHRLEAVPDHDFAGVAVALAKERGLVFTAQEFKKKLTPADRVLADNELDQVVGGAGGYNSRALGFNATEDSGGGSGYHVGCFAAGTRIALPDQAEIAVEALVPGKTVVCRADGASVLTHSGRAGPEAEPMVWLSTQDGRSIGVTTFHPMVLADLSVVAAFELEEGHLVAVLRDGCLSTSRIVALRRSRFAGLVYNFSLGNSPSPSEHFVVANGIVTGDLHLQACIESRRRQPELALVSS